MRHNQTICIRNSCMYFQKRNNKYSLIYYDSKTQRNIRLKQNLHPQFSSDEEAKAFCDNWDSKNKTTRTKARERLMWKEKSTSNLVSIIELFKKHREEDAPNTHLSTPYYLDYYILPFFLGAKEIVEIKDWPKYFEEFRDYLSKVKPLNNLQKNKKRSELSYATKDNIIKCLNALMVTAYRIQEISYPHKCRKFPSRLLNQKEDSGVIPKLMQGKIYRELLGRNKSAADMFRICLGTGLRMNEILGLSIADIFPESPHSELILNMIKPYHLKANGFIFMDSQPSLPSIRNRFGEIPRKPLKSKRKIGIEYGRIIPVFDPFVFNLIVDLWNKQRDMFERGVYGENPKNYILFHGMTKSKYSFHLRTVQKDINILHPYTPHDTRHTYSTWLASVTNGDYGLCRTILGHSSTRVTMRYVHINSKMKQSILVKNQLQRPLSFVEEIKEEKNKSNVLCMSEFLHRKKRKQTTLGEGIEEET